MAFSMNSGTSVSTTLSAEGHRDSFREENSLETRASELPTSSQINPNGGAIMRKKSSNKNSYGKNNTKNWRYNIRKGNKLEKDNRSDDRSRSKRSEYFVKSYTTKQYNKEPMYFENYDQNKKYARNDGFRLNNKENTHFSNCNVSASQRERLEDMIYRYQLECLVCCESIKNTHRIWTCNQCYHILHLKCIITWAKSSKLDLDWRCPACQYIYNLIPNKSKCYCGAKVDPKPDPTLLPHSCGNICLRKGRYCEHKCTILCHPGPCPDCTVMVRKNCFCGKSNSMVKCSLDVEIICKNICGRLLSCTVHKCERICHSNQCEPCNKQIIQNCHCGLQCRRVMCSLENKGVQDYSCGEICNKLLSCGNHKCQEKCHKGDCNPCVRDVTIIKTCPCKKMPLVNKRETCLDPIICCNNTCENTLRCGHLCQSKCHEGTCPPCDLNTTVHCRCGNSNKSVPCQEIIDNKGYEIICQKKCTKKRLCGKHKCNSQCCIEAEHICPLPCNRQLSCGNHKCPLTCHKGRCPPCVETSFNELYCECGLNVLYPPIACGTKPPDCTNECSRFRSCGHSNYHKCHLGPCPPCTVLCKKWCFGMHEQRSTIPCFQESFSCGLPCGKPTQCGKHKCNKPCHLGSCPTICQQPCEELRSICGHPCNQPCHDLPCPKSVCKQIVQVTCPCNLKKENRTCAEVMNIYKNVNVFQWKFGIADANDPFFNADFDFKQDFVFKILTCSEECYVYERNRKLAIGLKIQNPDLSSKIIPRYSDFMRQFAKKDPHFCQKIHDKLTDLVNLVKQSKQYSRSYSFECMNRDKRHFVHEYCNHFGCESVAYDQEPNRNVVATANKEKALIPSMSLLEVLQRENGQRKIPGKIYKNTNKSEISTLNPEKQDSIKLY